MGERFTDLAAFLAVERARLACDWRDLAVLCRFHSQLTPVARAMAGWGVPPGAAGPTDRLDAAAAQRFGRKLRDAAGDDPAGRTSAPVVEAVVARLAREHAVGSADTLRVADTARLLAAGHPRLDDFIEAWRPHEQSSGEERQGADGVTLATIHATKGREYQAVGVVDFAPSLQPLGDDEREEERRVLYVALTRARERALLTVDLGRGEPHPYLAELARPAGRRELTAARRSVRDLGRRLRTGASTLPAPLRAVLDETAADASGDAGADCMDRDTAVVAADYLAARSALVERKVFARRTVAATITQWARSS
jgi:ATP-dependent exoDNAse (exonuclease V) beta subunit